MIETVDINGPYFKHGFVRRGPISLKADKLAPSPDQVDCSVDRMIGIFSKGLLAAEKARQLGVKISRNWGDRQNEKAVSVMAKDMDLVHAFKLGIHGTSKYQPEPIDVADIWVVLAEEVPVLGPDIEVRGGVLVADQIPPHKLRGWVFLDSDFDLYEKMFPLARRTTDQVVARAVDVMNIVDPQGQRHWPIYGNSGNQYYPTFMTYKEIAERRSYS